MKAEVYKQEMYVWFKHLVAQKKSGEFSRQYCDRHNLDFNKFCNLRFRMIFNGGKNPELYESHCAIALEYLKSGMSKKVFAAKHGIGFKELNIYSLHVQYKEILAAKFGENYKDEYLIDERFPGRRWSPDKDIVEQEDSKPFFIQRSMIAEAPVLAAPVVATPEVAPISAVPEILEAKNNIEIIIKDGVKVIVSPELSSEKLFKIINLLREI